MRFILCILAIFLFGCAAKYNPPKLEKFEQKEFIVKFDKKVARLFVSNQDGVYKFVMIDSFGTPLSSKKLENHKFKNLKFLPPNSKFDKLYLEILEMLKNGSKENNFNIENTNFKVLYVS